MSTKDFPPINNSNKKNGPIRELRARNAFLSKRRFFSRSRRRIYCHFGPKKNHRLVLTSESPYGDCSSSQSGMKSKTAAAAVQVFYQVLILHVSAPFWVKIAPKKIQTNR